MLEAWDWVDTSTAWMREIANGKPLNHDILALLEMTWESEAKDS
jgi:hypothetical protein